ncbi:hypothetical protein ACHAWF_013580 [Thalassiosira exigua]
MLAALFHYRMHAADLMRFLGGTYTGEYRNIDETVALLHSHNIDPWLIAHYVRATTLGCPTHFVADSSRANAMLHWREGNHSSIKKFMVETLNTMAKERRNRFNIPLPCYIARYLPHLFLTPQHALDKPGKSLRLIFDAAKRYTATSTPINMMTSTPLGVELNCEYGDVLITLLERIWDLRITYPLRDIVTHANDVKSCFKQMKLHPDIMAAFSLIVTDFLYLQTALPFGTDFSPQNWEPCRRLIEELTRKLFNDDSLRTKHRRHLDKLRWDPSLGNYAGPFTPARACSRRQGVRDCNGNDLPTPHRLFVDDAVYADIYERSRERIERTVAASIESMYIILGRSDLSKRQDPISFDKLIEMLISHLNKILGQVIDTRTLDVGVPPDYRRQTVNLLRPFHSKRKAFTVIEMERLTGMLIFIASTAPWLKFCLSHVYASIAAALDANTKHLLRTNKDFRAFIREIKDKETSERHRTFAQSEAARTAHAARKKHWINTTLREELHLILVILKSKRVRHRTPIGHLVRRDPSARAWSDSCLYAAGGFSIDMRFWWYIDWPDNVRLQTLIYVRNNAEGKLISINVLEYAALIINYAAATLFYRLHPDVCDPYPLALFFADNTAAESWMMKACNSSLIGRALSRLQCAMMINNPLGFHTGHVTTLQNVIADKISRIKSGASWMQSFSAKCRAHLAHYGCDIAEEVNRSTGGKQDTTQRSRTVHFLDWCERMDPDMDPCLPTQPLQARNYLIACYAISLARGETLLHRQIRARTVQGYIRAVCKLHSDRELTSPYTADTDYIGIVLKALRKYEKMPNRREMIHDEMFHHMARTRDGLDPDSLDAALIDWCYLGRFVGFRGIEWCQTRRKKYHKIDHPRWQGPDSYAFILDDVQFYTRDNVPLTDHSTLRYELIHHFTLRFKKQKNNRNFEIIHYVKDHGNREFCPVAAILRIIARAFRLGLPLTDPLAVYRCAEGRYATERCFITDKQVATYLRKVAMNVYGLKPTSKNLDLWSAHSIRVTACNLLHRQGMSDTYIQTRLRWRSNAFLDYLRNTIYTASAHTKALTIPDTNLPRLTGNYTRTTLPSGETTVTNTPTGRNILPRYRSREELEDVLHAGAAAA